MKKLTPQFRAIIIIALIITASLPAFAYSYKKNDIYYTIIDEEKKTVKVTNCYSDKKKIVIPNSIKINGVLYSVTEIDDEAFQFRKKLKSVVIPNSVTSIGDRAFYNCSGLTSVTIPNSVTTIGYSAFSGCSGLTSVTIGNSVTTIGGCAFSDCDGLTEVNIIDLSAWCKIDFVYSSSNPLYYAKKLKFNGVEIKDLVIPNDITEIKNSAFWDCDGLTSVTIPNSVTSIGDEAFSGCTGLTEVTIPSSVTSIGNSAFWDCTGLTSVTIPNSVTSIGGCAFYGCSGLTSVTIGNSVTTIGNSAFKYCSGLTSVTIPNSVKEIGDCAFRDCYRLEYVIITNPNTRHNGNYSPRYNDNNYYYYYDVSTFDEDTKIIRPKQEEKSERDSYRWQYVSYGDDKRGAKSTDGKEIVPTEYSEVEYVPNYEGYFLVRKNGCYAIYNPSGKIIIPISRGYSSIIKTRSDGRIYYRVSKGGKYGVCGIDGYEIVAPLYDNIICIDGVFLYKDINGTWIPLNKGLDKNNAVVENPTYTKRDVAYYDLALQQGRLEDSFGKKVRVEQTSTEGTRAFKIVFEDKILFEFGEYDLSSSALDYIDKVAETLKELPSTRVRITGYTDNVGSLASNRLLSTQRANAVSEYLQQKGISASRIIAKGVPLADYVATNKTEEGRALNRRVEIIIEAK